MATQKQNTGINTNAPSKGLIGDLHESYIGSDVWTHARNATTNSHLGQIQFLQNEPSTLKCIDLPYTFVGAIRLRENKWAIFSTDNVDSEIGIFNESACTYSSLVNNKCLALSTKGIVKGFSKERFDCSESIYFTDGINPIRYLNIGKIPYTYTVDDDNCETKVYTKSLDCEAIKIYKNISVPRLYSLLSGGGSLRNGSYQFGIAYAQDKERVTEFFSITNPQAIWDHTNSGKSIVVNITGADRDFDQFQLVAITTIDGVTSYRSLGFYSTAERTVYVSSLSTNDADSLSPAEILQVKPRYPYADNIEANDQYLLFSGIKTKAQLNYQRQAMSIKPSYVIYRAKADYYKRGNTKGYMRDEIYSLAIQWLDIDGSWYEANHIPGPKDDSLATVVASGKDVYELKKGKLEKEIYIWEVENTASTPRLIVSDDQSEERIISEGEVGLWYSTEKYPDNEEMFGEDRCTPIRHIKMPSNEQVHHHSADGKYIYILGLKFENIEHPKGPDGKYLDNIVGYRIVRGDRFGNKTIEAKGMFSNVRAYNEINGNEVLYANYGHNDLRPDTFLSSSQTYNLNGEKGYKPLTGYKTDQYNFYSPETAFNHIGLGSEVKLYTEELSNVEGFFEHVYRHPRFKLLTQADLYFALVIGALDGYLSTKGKKCLVTYTNGNRTVTVASASSGGLPATQVETLIGLQQQQVCDDILNGMTASDKSKSLLDLPDKFIVRALKALANVGMFSYFALKTANVVLEEIYKFSPFRDYALQYNSYGFYSGYKGLEKDNTRRRIEHYQYLYDGVNSVEGKTFNNYKREDSVYIRLSDSIKEPTVIDDTRKSVREFNLCGDVTKKTKSTASMFYGAIKTKLPAQYGQLDGITYLDTGFFDGDLANVKDVAGERFYEATGVFGGDIFITRMKQKKTFHFFSQYLKEGADGFDIDYRLYRNVGFPRYWVDSTPFDISNVISLSPRSSNTPRVKHNLNCDGNNNFKSITTVNGQYFYTSNNSVIDFFVESELNLEFRDWKDEEATFYSDANANLSNLFRSDKLEKREEFLYDISFSKQLEENSIIQQRLDYNPTIDETCHVYLKNRVIYSLPSFKDQKSDNWLVFLANNFYDFPMADFGQLTAMHGVDNQQIMFLFDKAAPYITIARGELQVSEETITVGDAPLFKREPRPIAFTDYHYANCQSKWAFVNTQFGSFYPSQRQGRIFNYVGKLEEISRNGLQYWFKNYLPSRLLQDFPDYKHKDNTIAGVGLISVFDNTDERYYLSKRDYELVTFYKDKVTYNTYKDRFEYNGQEVLLTDTEYFTDASWTISYSPKDQAFISWHDWHPDFTLQGENHFMTVKNGAIWKHNQRCDSYCNFYDQDYPFSLEFVVNTGQNVEVLKSVEYFLEVGKYFNNCRDYHMILDENFDTAIVSNNEQVSGVLKMQLRDRNNLFEMIEFPKYMASLEAIRILYDKVEQKYRFNQFDDIIKDRGQTTGHNFPIWITQPNGYTKELNPKAIDYQKKDQQRKKFRNVWNKIMLTKQSPKEKKYIFKIANTKNTQSAR